MATVNPANSNRITGMSTGIDTDALVKAMSQTQQNKIDTLFKQKTLLEWRRDAITDVNNLLRTFKDEFTSLLGSSSMMKSETYRTMSIKNSNENAATIKAGVGATAGAYTMQIDEIATAARYEGKSITDTGKSPVSITNQTLGTLFGRSDWAEKDIDTTTFIDASGVPQEGYKIKINDKEFNFKATDKLSDVMNTINNDKTAKAQISFSQVTNSFTLSSKTTGADSKLVVSEDSSGFLRGLGLEVNKTDGNDAKFKINGSDYLYESSNTFTYDGIEYTLNATSEKFSFNTERDVSKSMDTIKKFVETLNGLGKTLSSYYTAKKNNSFYPLNDEAKADMSDSEIEKWDSKAKEGILNRDEKIGKIISSLQSLVTAKTGSGSLRDIGITGGQYMVGEPFKLEIDEDKLRKALEEDPDKVYGIFTEAADKTSGSEGGIIARIDNAFDTYTSHTKSFTLQTLRDNINEFGKNISSQTDKLYLQQEKLYVKYAAFESTMAKLNSQQSSLSSYFSS